MLRITGAFLKLNSGISGLLTFIETDRPEFSPK